MEEKSSITLGACTTEGRVIVMKFGGSSVADADRIHAVSEIVRRRIERRPVVVVSALAGVTDLLERAFDAARAGDLEGLEPLLADVERRHRWALAGCVDVAGRRHELGLEIDRLFEQLRQRLRSVRILGEGTPRVRDAVLAYGETLSTRIVTAAFVEFGLPARRVEAEQIIATDDHFGAASPDLQRLRERCRGSLIPLLEAAELPVIGGFVGASPAGETTTLGRGGSDTSAALLGLALEAEEIQIWTDVDGLMSADPQLVPGARTLERVSFAEAAELALYGARVLHPDSIAPAVRRRIPVRVLNSIRPEGQGTLIVGERPADDDGPVAVASKAGIGVARVQSRCMPMNPELPGRVLSLCAAGGIAPELLLCSATTVTLVASRPEQLERLTSLETEAEVELRGDCAIVCLVGSALAGAGSLGERVVAELRKWRPELVAWGALRASVLAVVRHAVLAESVRGLHDRFFEGGAVR
jgi:aspartate kinase